MSDKINKVRKPPGKAKFTDAEKIKVLKTLQLNGFNLAVTARQTGVSTNSIKEWREKYPQAFTNKYNERNLAIVEHNAKEDTLRIVNKSSGLIEKALKQAELLIELETDLSKLASFIRAATPLMQNLQALGEGKGYSQVASLNATLRALAANPILTRTDIDVATYEEIKE